jgi:hypothetical protein
MYNAILCTPEQAQIISALPLRFQRMITWYSICLKYHSDDLTRIDQVLDGRVIFYYPTKSGVNGAFDIVHQMNNRYTYDFGNYDFEVCRLICIDEKKRIELRYCDRSTHVPRDYLQQRGNYV